MCLNLWSIPLTSYFMFTSADAYSYFVIKALYALKGSTGRRLTLARLIS